MVWLYLCSACEKDNHGACELGDPSPPGTYGGSLCRCPCRGNPKWNTPEWHDAELRKVLESMMDHNKAVEEMQRIKDMAQITVPPKKIQLKKIDKDA